MIVVNKVDRLKPGHIAPQMMTAAKLGDFHALHPVSAKTGDGVGELRGGARRAAARGAAVLPDRRRARTWRTDAQIAELVREKALALTREELPHAIYVEVEEVVGRTRARRDLSSRPTRRSRSSSARAAGIVKEIGVRARPEIEQLLGRTVYLELARQGAADAGAATRRCWSDSGSERAEASAEPEPIPFSLPVPPMCTRRLDVAHGLVERRELLEVAGSRQRPSEALPAVRLDVVRELADLRGCETVVDHRLVRLGDVSGGVMSARPVDASLRRSAALFSPPSSR